jgi:hypothetical protein
MLVMTGFSSLNSMVHEEDFRKKIMLEGAVEKFYSVYCQTN